MQHNILVQQRMQRSLRDHNYGNAFGIPSLVPNRRRTSGAGNAPALHCRTVYHHSAAAASRSGWRPETICFGILTILIHLVKAGLLPKGYTTFSYPENRRQSSPGTL